MTTRDEIAEQLKDVNEKLDGKLGIREFERFCRFNTAVMLAILLALVGVLAK